MGHRAWGMGHKAWGIGHGALGMGHRAWGTGHGAWGTGLPLTRSGLTVHRTSERRERKGGGASSPEPMEAEVPASKLLKLTTGMPFRVFFMVLVLANVITLSITDNDMSTEAAERAGDAPNRDNIALKTTLDNVEWLFAFFFFVEMLLKMGALGLPKYLSNGFNVLDFFIVFCSIFELFATIAGLQAADVFNALRALRVFRLFKLLAFLQTYRIIITIIYVFM